MKLNRLLTITKKEFIHIKRDKPSLVIALLMPVMMLLLFGFAVTTDVTDVSLVIYDGNRTEESRELIQKFSTSSYFRVYNIVNSPSEVEENIAMGKVKVGLIIPADYTRAVKRNKAAEIQVLVDGSDPTIARTAMTYSLLITNNYSMKLKEIQASKYAQNMKSSLSITAQPLVLYNPTLQSAKFNVPGVIGLILQNITVILTSFSMVREKERGTIEQLIMTPVSPFELIIGKLIPYTIIGFFDLILVLFLGNLFFGITVRGSLCLLILLGTLFLVCALAMGMLISTISKTQLQAMQASLALLLPSVLLSGFMFPREAMPKFIYYLGNLLPLTYFLDILRGIMIKGIGIEYLMKTILSLSFLTALIVFATMVKFRKTLD